MIDVNDVKLRLELLGYKSDDSDGKAIEYCINKAEKTLTALTNTSKVPDGLFYVHADMAAGFFLKDRKTSGQLGEAFDFTAPAQSISEGDISVTFAQGSCGTPEEKFDALCEKLTTPDNAVILRYRRISWQ